MHRIAVLAFDGMSPFHLSVPSMVFRMVTVPDLARRYRVDVCTERPGELDTQAGFGIVVRAGLDLTESADTVIVPSWLTNLTPSSAVVDALRRAHERGARIVGLCLGSFALAGAGIVDGREVATHWSAADLLARRHPQVRVRSDVLWCDEGDVVTSAGVAAALDCCLHLLRSDCGSKFATEVARSLVLAPHRSGSQAQYIPVAVPDAVDDDPIEHAMVWARSNLGETVDLDRLAAIGFMSRRTFTRRFRERTGTSPQQWLLQQRTDQARLLLESTNDTVDRIAAQTGFGSAVTLRHHFNRILGTSPAAHRAAFRAG